MKKLLWQTSVADFADADKINKLEGLQAERKSALFQKDPHKLIYEVLDSKPEQITVFWSAVADTYVHCVFFYISTCLNYGYIPLMS